MMTGSTRIKVMRLEFDRFNPWQETTVAAFLAQHQIPQDDEAHFDNLLPGCFCTLHFPFGKVKVTRLP
jgi:hypothetical protein